MKIRVQPSPTAVEMIKLMGASPTPLAYGELYTALQQKVVDGAENNQTALTLARHGEVAKFYSEDEHNYDSRCISYRQNTWDKLLQNSNSTKKAAEDSMMYHKDLWQKMIAETTQEAKDKLGVEFVKVDKTPFIEATKSMHDVAKQNPVLKDYIEKIDSLATK